MKEVALPLIAFLLFSAACFSQYKCEIKNVKGTVVVIQGRTVKVPKIDIANFSCVGCKVNVYYSDSSKTVTYEISNISYVNDKDFTLNDKPVQQVNNIAKEIVSHSDNECVKELANQKIDSGEYKLIADSNKISVTVSSVSENDLEKFGLKMVYEPRNDITRIRELGRYYFLDSLQHPLTKQHNEAERFDFATDFIDGIAIIGNKAPEMSYHFINTHGEKSSFDFVKFEPNFGYKGIYKVTIATGVDMLVDKYMRNLTGSISNISYLSNDDYYRFYYTKDHTNLYGIFRIDSTGQILQSLAAKYSKLEIWKEDVICVVEDGTYKLLDARNKFSHIYSSDSKLTYVTAGDYGFQFNINKENKNNPPRGYFSYTYRKVVADTYSGYSEMSRFRLLRVEVKPYIEKVQQSMYTLLNEKGRRIFGNYWIIDLDPDTLGLIRVAKDFGKWYLVDSNENKVFPGPYYNLTRFNANGWALASVDFDKTGILDINDGKLTLFEKLFGYITSKDSALRCTPCKVFITFKPGLYEKYGVINYAKEPLAWNFPNKLVYRPSGIANVCLVTDDKESYLYYKDGERFLRDVGKITRPFKNGFAVAACSKGRGVSLIDTTGKIYQNCWPYDDLELVDSTDFAIATQNNLKGIVQIHTGEKYMNLLLKDIKLVGSSFICFRGDKKFVISTIPQNKIFTFVEGDKDCYESVLLKGGK